MLRWGCLLLGLASIALGVVGYLMHPPVATEARPVTINEAIGLFAEHDRIAVELDAGLDVDHRLFATLTERPHFTLKPTDITYEVNLAEGDPATLAPFLGNRVRLSAGLDAGAISLAVVSPRSIGDDELRGERILAPVSGTDGAVWAVSPFFSADDPERKTWLTAIVLEGVVSRLQDIGENLASFQVEYDYDQIRQLATTDLGITIDDHTLLIDTGNDEVSSGLYRLPVAGSRGALWAMPFYDQMELPPWAAAGPIRGLMWAWDADGGFDMDLALVSGLPIPARYGVIHHDETGAGHNEKTTFGLKLFTGLGGVMIAVSLAAFLLRRRRRSA